MVQSVFQINRQPVTDMNRKKVSEIQELEKQVFIEKPEKMLPECSRGTRERMVVRESFWVMAQKQDPDRFFWAHLISILSPVSM